MKDDAEDIEKLLTPLRRANPTAAMRAANRRAVSEALSATPWWRRSIAVPMPVALVTVAAMLLMTMTHTLPGREDPPPAGGPVESRVVDEAPRITPAGPGYARSETHQYFPGVGVVNRLVVYQPQETP